MLLFFQYVKKWQNFDKRYRPNWNETNPKTRFFKNYYHAQFIFCVKSWTWKPIVWWFFGFHDQKKKTSFKRLVVWKCPFQIVWTLCINQSKKYCLKVKLFFSEMFLQLCPEIRSQDRGFLDILKAMTVAKNL